MAYDEVPRKKIEVRDDKARTNYDRDIRNAKEYCNNGYRTDAAAEGVGYLGVDDLDRIRRNKLK